MDFDHPPNIGVMVLIGFAAFALLLVGCCCTAVFIPVLQQTGVVNLQKNR
jgi:hypothetical protein